jgi:hypothetical protein
VALSKAAKEVKFVFQVLRSMGVKVDLPIVVRVDNVGAIFIGTNMTVCQRSKHIDTRYHFMREYVQDDHMIKKGRSKQSSLYVYIHFHPQERNNPTRYSTLVAVEQKFVLEERGTVHDQNPSLHCMFSIYYIVSQPQQPPHLRF